MYNISVQSSVMDAVNREHAVRGIGDTGFPVD